MREENKMTRRDFIGGTAATAFLAGRPALGSAAPRPNIVMLYADDLGYGDTSCYGAQRVQTPNIDRLARRGIRFTDAHTSAATCTPSRYSLLTGEYAFRMQGAKVLPGDAPALIQPSRVTLASMLKQRGYRTQCDRQVASGAWERQRELEHGYPAGTARYRLR